MSTENRIAQPQTPKQRHLYNLATITTTPAPNRISDGITLIQNNNAPGGSYAIACPKETETISNEPLRFDEFKAIGVYAVDELQAGVRTKEERLTRVMSQLDASEQWHVEKHLSNYLKAHNTQLTISGSTELDKLISAISSLEVAAYKEVSNPVLHMDVATFNRLGNYQLVQVTASSAFSLIGTPIVPAPGYEDLAKEVFISGSVRIERTDVDFYETLTPKSNTQTTIISRHIVPMLEGKIYKAVYK